MSLPVVQSTRVGGHATKIKHSRASWWRFVVLLTVNLAIAGHIAVWLFFAMRKGVSPTLSPVEPSESMYTLETGVLNAGFIFFSAAILVTMLLGRFVCGWGCHIIALQDLCTWLMTRIGVRPRPFRSRLLLYVPLVMALYMFVWPSFKRLVLRPLAGDAWPRIAVWLGDVPQWPGWSSGLIVEDFWRTFPAWYVVIPFLLVCGFGAVYFLGSKGFCTYACPYGGFFGPADLLAVGKIRVTDDCEQCGHCTASCTSNVRVHEEVRDFGMVVDPGCMKCMDCISVCPNDALYFGLGKPAILAKPRDVEAKIRRAGMKGNFDLSWGEEVLVAAAFALLFMAFRGFLNQVPLLMALAMAGIGAFSLWKLVRLVRDPSVRLQSVQLKLKGRMRPAGVVFAVLALAYLAMGGWSGAVRASTWFGGLYDNRVLVPHDAAFSPGFRAPPEMRAAAERAIALYSFAGPPGPSGGAGGIGWRLRPETAVRLAYLSMVCSRVDEAERHLREAISAGGANDPLVYDLSQMMLLRGATPEDVVAMQREMLAAHPRLVDIRRALAVHELENEHPDAAVKLYEEGIALMPQDPMTRANAAGVLLAAGQAEKAIATMGEAADIALGRRGQAEALQQISRRYADLIRGGIGNEQLKTRIIQTAEAAAKRSPSLNEVFFDLGGARFLAGDIPGAIEALLEADRRQPDQFKIAEALAVCYGRMSDLSNAQRWVTKAQELQARQAAPAPVPPSGAP